MDDNIEQIKVLLDNGMELVIRLESRTLKAMPDDDCAKPAEGSVVVFGHVPRPPPKQRAAILSLSVPLDNAARDCETTSMQERYLFEMVLGVEFDEPSSKAASLAGHAGGEAGSRD